MHLWAATTGFHSRRDSRVTSTWPVTTQPKGERFCQNSSLPAVLQRGSLPLLQKRLSQTKDQTKLPLPSQLAQNSSQSPTHSQAPHVSRSSTILCPESSCVEAHHSSVGRGRGLLALLRSRPQPASSERAIALWESEDFSTCTRPALQPCQTS